MTIGCCSSHLWCQREKKIHPPSRLFSDPSLNLIWFHHKKRTGCLGKAKAKYNGTLLLDTGHSPHLIYATLQSPGRKSSPHSPACSPATIAHREPWNSDPLIFFARNSSLGPSLVFHLQKKATQKTQYSYLPWTSPCIH